MDAFLWSTEREKACMQIYPEETPVVGRGSMDGGVMGESREEAIKVEERG